MLAQARKRQTLLRHRHRSCPAMWPQHLAKAARGNKMKTFESTSIRKMSWLWLVLLGFLKTSESGNGGFYSFTVQDIKGDRVSLEPYRGKVRLCDILFD